MAPFGQGVATPMDRPNLSMNNCEKIIGGDLLWRPTEAAKNPIFERF